MIKRRLYILGNGFDIANGITSVTYQNFYKFVQNGITANNKNKESFEKTLLFLDIVPAKELNLAQYDNICVKMDYTEEKPWFDLETRLSFPNINELESHLLNYLNDKDEVTQINQFVSKYFKCTPPLAIGEKSIPEARVYLKTVKDCFQSVFNEWVLTKKFEYKRAVPFSLFKHGELSFMNNSKDLFFTFNYTTTLEHLFKVPSSNIIHIHGCVDDIPASNMIVGHNSEQIYEQNNKTYFAELIGELRKEEIAFFQSFSKNSKSLIKNNGIFKTWFQNLESVDCDISEIIIFGHSLGIVDSHYFISFFKLAIKKRIPIKIYAFIGDPFVYVNLNSLLRTSDDYNYSLTISRNISQLKDYHVITIQCEGGM